MPALPLHDQSGLFEHGEAVIAPAAKAPSYLADHRQRLRERFMSGGAEALPDYELLELILFRAIPRQDVKPLARALIDQFGDFGGVISASDSQLASLPGVGPAVIVELKLIEAAAQRLTRLRAFARPVISGWSAVIDYCRSMMAHQTREHFRVLYLDRKNALIADEEQGKGTVDHVPVYPREVIKRGLDLNASALILVHNHPSGDPSPSNADIETTRQIAEAGALMGITLHDHIIIGRGREFSFRASGHL